jgi:uncharacterized coiled-coil protein SlyX
LSEKILALEMQLGEKETQLSDLNHQLTMQRTQLELSRLEVSRLEDQEAMSRKVLTEVMVLLGPHNEIFDDKVTEEGYLMLDYPISQSVHQLVRKYETLKTEHTQVLNKLKDTEAYNLELTEMVTELMHVTEKLIDERHQLVDTDLAEIFPQQARLATFSKMAHPDVFTKMA